MIQTMTMRIDIATLFPDMCDAVLNTSILGRGIKNGFIELHTHNIREFTEDRHRNVDDKPYGGGTGMVMQAQPIYDCVQSVISQHLDSGRKSPRIIYMSPQGKVLTQRKVAELAKEDGIVIICGHYEGIDERVIEELNAEEISVGDYVLTGGELPALILTDAVARLQEGVLPNEDAYSIESHFSGLLEYPQYTRPEVWKSRAVPEILLSGAHSVVSDWQLAKSLEVTKRKRPDMYDAYINKKISDFWNKFIKEKKPSDDSYCVTSLSDDEIRKINRGKIRQLPLEYYKNSRFIILLGELMLPRCIVEITAVKEKVIWIKTVFKG